MPDSNGLIILNEYLLVSHLGAAESVSLFSFGWKVHCLPIEFCRPIKLVLVSSKCLTMTCFQRATGCFYTWIETWVIGCTKCAALLSTTKLYHQCEIQTTIQSAWILFKNESTGSVCFFLSSFIGTINHSKLVSRRAWSYSDEQKSNTIH